MAERQAGMRSVGDAGLALFVRQVARHHADNPRWSESAPGELWACLNAFGVGDHRRARATRERERFEEMDAVPLGLGGDEGIRGIAGQDPGSQDGSLTICVPPRLKRTERDLGAPFKLRLQEIGVRDHINLGGYNLDTVGVVDAQDLQQGDVDVGVLMRRDDGMIHLLPSRSTAAVEAKDLHRRKHIAVTLVLRISVLDVDHMSVRGKNHTLAVMYPKPGAMSGLVIVSVPECHFDLVGSQQPVPGDWVVHEW